MDDLGFLEGLPEGDATLYVVHTGGSTSIIANLNLDTIEDVSPVLAHAFENTKLGPKHSIEEMSFAAVASLLRHVHTSQHYMPEHQLDEQTSLIPHVEIYCLAIIYDIPTLKTMAKGRISTELMLATSSPEPPQDLCKALDYVYEHLPNERDLVETLAHYCIACLVTHKLTEDVKFKDVHGKYHQLQQDLCSIVRTNEFEDETAAAIIQLSVDASLPPPPIDIAVATLDQRLASLPPPPAGIASPMIDMDEESEEKIQLKAEVEKLETKVETLNQQITAHREEIRRFTAIGASRDFYRDKLASVAQRDRMMYWDKQQLKATVDSQNLEIQNLQRQLEATLNAKTLDDIVTSETNTDATLSACGESCGKGAYEESDQEVTVDFEMMFGPSTSDAQDTVQAHETLVRQDSPSTSSSGSDYDMMETPTDSRTVSPEPMRADSSTLPELNNTNDAGSRIEDMSDEDWSICGRSPRGGLIAKHSKQTPFQLSSDTMEIDESEDILDFYEPKKTSTEAELKLIIEDLVEELEAANEEVEFLDQYIQSLYEAQATLVRHLDTARLDQGDNRWTIHALNLQLERLIERTHRPETDSEWASAYINSKQRELQKAYERIYELRNASQTHKEEMDGTRLSEQNTQGAINRLRNLVSQHRNDGKSQEQIDWDVQWEAKQQYRSQAEELEYLGDAVEHINSFVDGLIKSNNILRSDLRNNEIHQQETETQVTVLQSDCDTLETELDEARNELDELGFHLECADVARQSMQDDAKRKQQCCEELLDENKKLKSENETLEMKTQYLEGITRNGMLGYLGEAPIPDNVQEPDKDGVVNVWDNQRVGGSGGDEPWQGDGDEFCHTAGDADVESDHSEFWEIEDVQKGEREQFMSDPERLAKEG